jgi:hypothetical protein
MLKQQMRNETDRKRKHFICECFYQERKKNKDSLLKAFQVIFLAKSLFEKIPHEMEIINKGKIW